MGGMFAGCMGLTNLDLSSFDTKKVTNMAGMFEICVGLTSLDLSSWDTSIVTDMSEIFFSCENLVAIYVSKDWTTSAVTSGSKMFYGCTKLVGGNGTAYNGSYIDKSYAVIDTAETPGYLTLKEN